MVPEFFLTKLNIERILAVLETNPCSARNLLESRENAQQQRKINLTRGSFRIFSFLVRIGSNLSYIASNNFEDPRFNLIVV